MPRLRKLSPAEVQAIEDKGKSLRKLTEEQYNETLAGFASGDYGELIPDFREKRLTARNRLKAAAKRRSLSLTFLRSPGDVMQFKVDTGGGQAKPKRVRRERDYQDQPTPVVPSLNMPPRRKGD